MITQIGFNTLITLSTPPVYTKLFDVNSVVHDNTIFNKCHFGSYLITPIYKCYIEDIAFYNQTHESYNLAPIILTDMNHRLVNFKTQHKMTLSKWISKLWRKCDYPT